MKGKALCAGDLGSDKISFSPERGVRGDEPAFPQDAHPPDLGLQSQVQHQVYQQGWSYEMIRQFIADRFEGKRWHELDSEEQLLLLYYLQTVETTDATELNDPRG